MTTTPVIRIGTRSSQLALWQANWVREQLEHQGHAVELVKISTKGDVTQSSLSIVGGQGAFTKEIQNALLDDRVDLAVHSLKDLPTFRVDGLKLASVPPRESTLDCLIARESSTFQQLPAGSRIGTGSTRRAAQLLAWRPDIRIEDIRGNVDSRLKKLDEGQYDAIVLAAAGLHRLGLYARVTQELPQDRVLPAVGQGALGLECRTEDTTTQAAVQALNDPATQACVVAERHILFRLAAGCLAPVAAQGTVQGETLKLRARVLSNDGSRQVDAATTGGIEAAEGVAEELAQQLIDAGAEELIAQSRS